MEHLLAKLPKPEPKTQIERIRDVHPRYADLLERNSALIARQAEIVAEIKPLSEQERRQPALITQAPKPKPQPVKRHDGALALVGKLLSPQREEELSPPPARPNWSGEERLRELGIESEAITEALRLLVPEIKKARLEYSKLVATKRGPEHTALVEKIVDAAKVLGSSMIEYHQFIDDQRQDSVAYRQFRPLNLERFGNLNEPSQPLMQLILDAVERGHVGAGKIPADWKMPADIMLANGGE
jgi:hypothetical protein